MEMLVLPEPQAAGRITPARTWLPYSDRMRILAMLAVVTGHVADMVMFNSGIAGTRDWWVCNAANALCRWAVPVYVMLSGSLWLAPERGTSIRDFYVRRFMRIGVPLLVWSPLYMLFSVYYTRWVTPHDAWMNLLRGQPYAHLHFVAVIAGLYAFTPAMRVLVAHADRGLLWMTVVLALALGAGNSVAAVATDATPNIFLRFVPFIGYYLAGYLLRDVKLSRRGMLACTAGAVACMAALTLTTGFFVLRVDHAVKAYPSWSMMAYDFLSAPRIVLGILMWLLLSNAFSGPWPQGVAGRRIVKELAACTFGIYLVHPAIREFLYCGIHPDTPIFRHLPWVIGHRLYFDGWQANRITVWLGLPLVVLMVYIPSVLLVMLLKRIPYVRGIIG